MYTLFKTFHGMQMVTSAETKHASLQIEDDLEKLVMGKEHSSDHANLKVKEHFELECFECAAREDFERGLFS
jgi:hypothetical protein